MPEGTRARGIVVFTPRPSDEAQRAEALMQHLSAQGIPYTRTDSADFDLSSREEASRVTAMMNGPVPVVYVNGRAKANPSPAEVVAEFRRGNAG